VYNKGYFLQRLEAEVRKAAKTGRPLSLIIMDVDNFKRYNDTYGHPEGDVVLRTLAEVITAEIRDHDVGCRYGGEEFTVIFPDVAGDQILKAADRIRQSFARRTFQPDAGATVSVTVSIGMAQLRSGEDASCLIRRADKALYQSKQKGKNQVVAATH
jgi:diguanylate cyclase (GGDEF)-like protein